ncbi:MAG: arginine deiminase family protein [Acidimicrobiia bacterium]
MVPFGASSMTAPLTHVLVQRPHAAFGRAFDDPASGFRHPVDLVGARREHDRFTELLASLGAEVHLLGADDHPSPDLVYAYDPALVTDRGAILLRSGKPGRRGEERAMAAWFEAHGIPIAGRIEVPGTVDGGDVFWLQPDVACVGRSLRTNRAGIEQLAGLLDGDLHVFDVPYDAGPAECLHLLSVISPVAADLAVVEMARLPAGLYELLADFGVLLVPVPPEEVASLGCNVLAVRPGVVVMLEDNPVTASRLAAAGCEVHTFDGREICHNGSGGPTCLTRPVRREPA